MRDHVIDAVLCAVLVTAAAIWTAGVSTSQNQSIDRAHAVLRSR